MFYFDFNFWIKNVWKILIPIDFVDSQLLYCLAQLRKTWFQIENNRQRYFKQAIHGLFLAYFQSYKANNTIFKTNWYQSNKANNTIFTTNWYEKSPSNILCRESNSRPLEHQYSPITARPKLPVLIPSDIENLYSVV